ncbi:hypothetical protein BCV70DRAFT_200687 [Testicularia cyperi]|uniref:Uncharacterized protein n=1 Tax=Testicularia cyperi TaxID=1882483 RepID=A0A317XNA7_9BASI|nr:hypothetical protein BCV70DRAFT_200687 [Testicularia cyperi]
MFCPSRPQGPNNREQPPSHLEQVVPSNVLACLLPPNTLPIKNRINSRRTVPRKRIVETMRAAPVLSRLRVGLGARSPVAASPRNAFPRQPRAFATSSTRADDQSRAKATNLKTVMNRPEITPLFLFTGGMICLALFFASKHLLTDKELQLDHKAQSRLKTETEKLDFDSMAKVADDPDGKLTKEGIEEEKRRQQRLQSIRDEKEQKSKQKL